MKSTEKHSLSSQLEFMWTYLKPYKWSIYVGVFLVFISTAIDQISPWMIKEIIDGLNTNAPQEQIYQSLAWLLGSTLVAAVMLFWQRNLLITTSRKAEYQMRNDLFQEVQYLERAFFDKHPVGDIMSKSTNDLDHVRDLIGPVLLHLGRMLLLFVYTAICLWWISPWMALVGLSMAALLPVVTSKFMKKIYAMHASNQSRLSALNVFVREVFNGITIVKSYGKEKQVATEFEQKSLDFRDTSIKMASSNALIWPTIALLSGLGLCLSILVGSYLVVQNKMTIGALSASVLYLVKLQFPLVGLGWVMSTIQRGRASLDRIMNLKDEMVPYQNAPSVQNEAPIEFENIEFKNVSLSLDGQEILKDLTFELKKGKKLGIVGETGSGKTMLTHLITGVYPGSGQIIVNSNSDQKWSKSQYRQLFSIAPQDGFLFSDSIRNNILIGSSSGKSDLELEDVVRMACLDQDIPHIPNGLDAMLGERGINLSGGQKQRVGLARALLHNAPIVILDDTLSALDTETEARLIQNLKEGSVHQKEQEQSFVIVAHRYSAVVECDEILNLKNGQITERGTHLELIALGGEYARNWKIQQVSADLL